MINAKIKKFSFYFGGIQTTGTCHPFYRPGRTELLRWLRKGEPVLCRLNKRYPYLPLDPGCGSTKTPGSSGPGKPGRTTGLHAPSGNANVATPTLARETAGAGSATADPAQGDSSSDIASPMPAPICSCPGWLLLIEDSLLQLSQKEEALDLMLQEAREKSGTAATAYRR